MPEISRDKIIQLRRLGKTYQEIKNELGVSKSALSRLLSSQDFSRSVAETNNKRTRESRITKLVAINKSRKGSTSMLFEEARSDALEEFGTFKFHPLFIAGLMLYDAHGLKGLKGGCLVSSGDPDVVRLWLRFLNDICGISSKEVIARVLTTSDTNPGIATEFWVKSTSIPVDKFRKYSIIKKRSRKKRTFYGICTVGVYKRYLKEKILIWLSLIRKELLGSAYYQDILFPKK